MKRTLIILVLAMLALAGWADKKPESIESLKARVGAADAKHQVDLLTKVAEVQMAATTEAYSKGDAKQAKAALADVVEYGVKAAQTASATRHHMKNTEIALRRIGDQLENLRKSLDTDERPPVAEAVKKIEAARDELLNAMFRK